MSHVLKADPNFPKALRGTSRLGEACPRPRAQNVLAQGQSEAHGDLKLYLRRGDTKGSCVTGEAGDHSV